MPSIYDKGDVVRCSGAFTDSDGVAQDPAAVFCEYRDPSGNVTDLEYGVDGELVKSAVGSYYVDVDADEVGFWYYRFYSTGTGQAADEDVFRVASQFGT